MPPEIPPAVSPLSAKALEAVAPGEAYEALLDLFALSEPKMAAERFIWLRTKILRFFSWRGKSWADELTDEVLSRLARKVAEGAVTEAGDLPGYALGIARRVLSESLRWQSRRSRDLAALAYLGESPWPEPESLEQALNHVEECLATLGAEEHDLLLSYYEGAGSERIQVRRRLAKRLGIPMNALRLRAFRIRRQLQKCLRKWASLDDSSEVEFGRGDQ